MAFNYPGAPITNLRVTIENGSVVQRGTLHKGVAIPFQMWSVPAMQPDGRLKLHPDKLTILGVNGLSLMHALGLHLDNMMNLSKARGVTVKGDDLYLDPLAIIPHPVVEGKLKSVRDRRRVPGAGVLPHGRRHDLRQLRQAPSPVRRTSSTSAAATFASAG